MDKHSDHPNVKKISEFNFPDLDEKTLKRLCQDVPCEVNLSVCNVITWFEKQVQKKVKKNGRWKVLLDKQRADSVLRRKGAFFYDYYLSSNVVTFRRNSRSRLLAKLLTDYPAKDRNKEDSEVEHSIDTIFDTSTLFDTDRELPSLSQESFVVATQNSYPFDYDQDMIITSTQS